jgi:hypothetical protein
MDRYQNRPLSSVLKSARIASWLCSFSVNQFAHNHLSGNPGQAPFAPPHSPDVIPKMAGYSAVIGDFQLLDSVNPARSQALRFCDFLDVGQYVGDGIEHQLDLGPG